VNSSCAADTSSGCVIWIDSAGLDSAAAVKPLDSKDNQQHQNDLPQTALINTKICLHLVYQSLPNMQKALSRLRQRVHAGLTVDFCMTEVSVPSCAAIKRTTLEVCYNCTAEEQSKSNQGLCDYTYVSLNGTVYLADMSGVSRQGAESRMRPRTGCSMLCCTGDAVWFGLLLCDAVPAAKALSTVP